MSSQDPISNLIDNITASQKRKDDLSVQVKTFDTLIATYETEFAKLQQREKSIDLEMKDVLDSIAKLEKENEELKLAEKHQMSSRSKMLLTLQNMAVKKDEIKRLIDEEIVAQKQRIDDAQAKYSIMNAKFVKDTI